jgi:acetolactate synthase I/II/III large subunit
MNGAESLVRTLIAAGVDTCFANPGTSEIHFVAALDRNPGMRCVLALFEGVVTGAADGYGRMARKPAATLMHCGPGMANGLSLLHNAKRASTPIVNIVGDQATYHAPLDPPLAADVEGWARQVSQWVYRAKTPREVGSAAAEAVQHACRAPGGSATLILPSDVSWGEPGEDTGALPKPPPMKSSPEQITGAVQALKSGQPAVLLVTGPALLPEHLATAHKVARATGARLMTPTFNARIARGRGRPPVDAVPYPVDEAVALLKGTKQIVAAGTGAPVAFFAYPGKPGIVSPKDAQLNVLARADQDVPDALERLAAELNCRHCAIPETTPEPMPLDGALTVENAARSVSALLPDDAMIVDEAISLRGPFFRATKNAAAHDWLQVPGGAIGGGLPLATGAAIAAPDRRTVVLEGDGSAMYTVQALWTQAREKLNVTTLILSNRKYAILELELRAAGAPQGNSASDLFGIERPGIDWVQMANAHGVEAARADTVSRFADLFRTANSRRGPFLIELTL